jgi:hypothetical protein
MKEKEREGERGGREVGRGEKERGESERERKRKRERKRESKQNEKGIVFCNSFIFFLPHIYNKLLFSQIYPFCFNTTCFMEKLIQFHEKIYNCKFVVFLC